MLSIQIQFSNNPWWLLLLIPAVILTLFPYFRLAKKYRRTRNRITSVVLHLLIMLFAISALSGMQFLHSTANMQNEVIFLIDMSETEELSKAERNDFVQNLLAKSKEESCRVGVVTFGFTQQYVVPLTRETDDIYKKYLSARLPDTSATDIASALMYAKDLFDNPQTGKIVLITDGKETDQEAFNVIGSIVAQGTRIDTAYIPSEYKKGDVQISDIILPDYHVNINEECSIGAKLQNNDDSTVETVIELYDNGEKVAEENLSVLSGEFTVNVKHTFAKNGLHELKFVLKKTDEGELKQNNEYFGYMYLEVYNKILMLGRTESENKTASDFINQEKKYEITSKLISTEENVVEELPATVDELRAYDQIILNNVANQDMTEEFVKMLQSYVSDYGGGVFTLGGNDESGNEHAYNRKDMWGSSYQKMLPVQAIEYTPPTGVFFLIDRSGSMGGSGEGESSRLEWAVAGAWACINSMEEWDYVGVATFDDAVGPVAEMTACTFKSQIGEKLNRIETVGASTQFKPALEYAGEKLLAEKRIARRHIVLVTDGAPSDPPSDNDSSYEGIIQRNFANGITLSIVLIGSSSNAAMERAAVELGHGRLYHYSRGEEATLITDMKGDIEAKKYEEIKEEPFYPIVKNEMSVVVRGIERGGAEGEENRNKMTVSLGGFYGVKARAQADVILAGEYDFPIYAQWKYGKGTVGSFMCDLLKSSWSQEFMTDQNGLRLVNNIIDNLMPTENIRPREIPFELKESNYTNQLNIYANIHDGETIRGELFYTDGGVEKSMSLNTKTVGNAETDIDQLPCYVRSPLSAGDFYSSCTFVIKKGGTYRLVLKKYDKDGNEIAVTSMYKTFSYSAEYDTYIDSEEEDFKGFLEAISKRSGGSAVKNLKDPVEVFESFERTLDKMFDPRFLFMILAIILFLADVAVRKFKFKWIHELIREHKQKKQSK